MKFIISINDDRHTAFLKRAADAFGEATSFTRIAITPENLPTPVPAWWEVDPSRWAVVQALCTALNMAKEAGEDCELFEDDCIFTDGFAEKRAEFLAHLPEDWDMAYLGGQLLAREYYPLTEVEGNDTVLLCKNAHRNHAWICRHRTIERLVNWLLEPYWPCRQTSDHRIGYLQMKDDFKVYIPKAGWLCGQGASLSQLDGIEYPDRWWHYTEPERTQELERIRPFFEEMDRKMELKRRGEPCQQATQN